jgi:mono/diheme cytochrome c family protein
MRRRALWAAAILVGAFLLIQAVPYGRAHSNPKPSRQAAWTDPAARGVFKDACADCHSDHTNWRWYTNVAPASWLVQNDVDGGRSRFNVSEWDTPQPAVDALVQQIDGGGMPPLQYKLVHPSARLSAARKRRLVAGVRALYAADPPP